MIAAPALLAGLTCAAFDPWAAAPSQAAGWVGAARPKSPAPARIVSLAPNVTELVLALGAGSRLVGVTRYDDDLPEVRGLPRVGGFVDPNVEAVVGLGADLVVGVPNGGNRRPTERLAELGIPVLVVPGNAFQDLAYATRALAAALGGDAPARGQALLDRVAEEVRAVRATYAGRRPPRVAFVYDHAPLVLAGPGSFADTILGVVGAANVVASGPPYPSYSLERLLADGPEVIVDAAGTHGGGVGGYWSRWTSMPAVRDGRVYVIRDSALFRVGPRLGEAVRQTATLVYPKE